MTIQQKVDIALRELKTICPDVKYVYGINGHNKLDIGLKTKNEKLIANTRSFMKNKHTFIGMVYMY